VRELGNEEQRRFLKFFTGSDRAPIGGLGNLRCVIQRNGGNSTKLPTRWRPIPYTLYPVPERNGGDSSKLPTRWRAAAS